VVRKIQNHHRALTDYLNASFRKPFQWGTLDCVIFAIGAIEAMIGGEVDKPEFTYTTQEEALEFSKTWSLAAGMVDQLNAYEVPRHFHQPGDILIINDNGIERTYVVFDRRAYSPMPGGTVTAFNVYQLYEKCTELKLLRFD
jgi:hypothetical protein